MPRRPNSKIFAPNFSLTEHIQSLLVNSVRSFLAHYLPQLIVVEEMDDLSQLERYADNFIIDELSWHVSNRGIPASIKSDCADLEAPRVVFAYSNGREWTHDIDPGLFVDHWNDAVAVLRDFPSVPQLADLPKTVVDALQPFREQKKDAIARWNSETKQNCESGPRD